MKRTITVDEAAAVKANVIDPFAAHIAEITARIDALQKRVEDEEIRQAMIVQRASEKLIEYLGRPLNDDELRMVIRACRRVVSAPDAPTTRLQ